MKRKNFFYWQWFKGFGYKRFYIYFKWLSLKRGTGNEKWGTETGNEERGTRNEVNHLPRNLHSEQFEGAEFIDGNSFLWFLTPVNVGTCHFSGHSFGRRVTNALILMKLCILHKLRTLSPMVTIVFGSF